MTGVILIYNIMRVTIGKSTVIVIKGQNGEPDIEIKPSWIQEEILGKGKNREHKLTFYKRKTE